MNFFKESFNYTRIQNSQMFDVPGRKVTTFSFDSPTPKPHLAHTTNSPDLFILRSHPISTVHLPRAPSLSISPHLTSHTHSRSRSSYRQIYSYSISLNLNRPLAKNTTNINPTSHTLCSSRPWHPQASLHPIPINQPIHTAQVLIPAITPKLEEIHQPPITRSLPAPPLARINPREWGRLRRRRRG
jgi:hypothetical protein